MKFLLAVSYFFYFHAPDGSLVSLKPFSGQVIVRKSPPGFACCTLIQTGVGNIVVKESVCEVLNALDRRCGK